MIYLLINKNEMNFAKVWQGHFNIVYQALALNESHRFCKIEIEKTICTKFKKDDIIINFGNHQYLGSYVLNCLAESICKVSRTVFFMDDYQAPPPTQLRKAITKSRNFLLTNIKDLKLLEKRKSLDMFEKIYVDLNKASFKLLPFKEPKYPKSFIYWGSFRKGRIDKFDEYFRPQVYKVFISSSDKSHKKFENEYFNYRPLDKFKTMPDDLQNYGFTVYMHDKKAPVQSPANRFYEAIGAGLPIFFDIECLPSGLEIPSEFIIHNAREIPLNNDLKAIQLFQRAFWGQQDYQRDLINEMAKIFYEYGVL